MFGPSPPVSSRTWGEADFTRITVTYQRETAVASGRALVRLPGRPHTPLEALEPRHDLAETAPSPAPTCVEATFTVATRPGTTVRAVQFVRPATFAPVATIKNGNS